MSESTKSLLETLSQVLAYCSILGILLLLAAIGLSMVGRGFIYQLHGAWFGLSVHEIDVFVYGWLGLLKICIFVLFVIPWLSLCWALRSK